MKRILASLFLLLGLSLTQVGLATSQIHTVRGFMPDLKFTLISAHKPEFTEKDVRGKVVLMFFGYANCPDICPTSMAQLADVMEKLGNDAEKVRILFVSVDPHRDTASMLQEYVENFDDRYALGLTGTPQQIADLARRYRVAYQIEKPRGENPNAYEVSHSRGVYFFDTKGKARYLASDSEEVEALVEKVRSLL
ncbi:SCO family protein [Paenalcaligenes hominis]|uniref:SCO family protein n=1 Tax=Paenalcaligenes hominis TaxID=643674 RepID=A0A1U9JXX9_9BURK|nr:SCO family protein [Paenalcaligenes hominis]AQS50650.1 SCO family protein [Paenalcaligenes hominis]